MQAPKLLVIQHDKDAHLNELGGPLLDAGLAIVPWFAPQDPSPVSHPDEVDGVISLGAIAGLKDEAELPWMSTERALLEKALANDTPTLGVCFGAQILASVGGAPVTRLPAPEIGWGSVTMEPATADDPVLHVLGPRADVFQFHYDTFDTPDDGMILGRSGDLNQAFRIGHHAWGIQFHVETNPGAIYSWVATYGAEMQAGGVDLESLRTETAERWSTYRELCRALGTAFAQQVEKFTHQR
ncbi:MAG TPA: type 1 glutamine amidotransferase [Vicinamibacterales bacterium]